MESKESAISRAPSLRRSVLWQSDTDSSTVPIRLPLVDYSFIPGTWYFKRKTADVDREQRIKEEASRRARIMVVEWKCASFSLLSASVFSSSLFRRFPNNLNSTGSFEQSPSSRVLNFFFGPCLIKNCTGNLWLRANRPAREHLTIRRYDVDLAGKSLIVAVVSREIQRSL